jgi:RNA polymerase sigma factor (sigma-70 family)
MEQQGGPSDAELVRRALGATAPEDRKAAFTAISDRYHLTVLRQCARWFPHPEEAQDVCQDAFEAAFTLLSTGKAPERPDKLAGWLIEIARRRAKQYRRKDKPPGVSWAILPEGQSLDQIEDDEEPRSGSALRRAHATHLVESVVTTLTARQQEIYQLRYVQELTGREVAERLNITGKAASNEITHVQDLIATGFGALILYQEGRKYCPDLARIIETVPAPVGSTAFSTTLRERIVRHFEDCNICDDCRTCNTKRRELVGPYVPALIPILFGADLRDRITELIDRITRRPAHPPPAQRGSGHRADTDAILTADVTAATPKDSGAPGNTAKQQSSTALRRRPAVLAGIIVVILAVAGAGAAALASGGGPPANSSAAGTSITGTYTFTRKMLTCTGMGRCLSTPLPIHIDCPANGSCVVSAPGHWGSSHTVTFNGKTVYFSATDVGVVGPCNGTPTSATITLDLTVVSWSVGHDSVRRPKRIQGPYSYTYTSAANGACPGGGSKEILTYP